MAAIGNTITSSQDLLSALRHDKPWNRATVVHDFATNGASRFAVADLPSLLKLMISNVRFGGGGGGLACAA